MTNVNRRSQESYCYNCSDYFLYKSNHRVSWERPHATACSRIGRSPNVLQHKIDVLMLFYSTKKFCIYLTFGQISEHATMYWKWHLHWERNVLHLVNKHYIQIDLFIPKHDAEQDRSRFCGKVKGNYIDGLGDSFTSIMQFSVPIKLWKIYIAWKLVIVFYW